MIPEIVGDPPLEIDSGVENLAVDSVVWVVFDFAGKGIVVFVFLFVVFLVVVIDVVVVVVVLVIILVAIVVVVVLVVVVVVVILVAIVVVFVVKVVVVGVVESGQFQVPSSFQVLGQFIEGLSKNVDFNILGCAAVQPKILNATDLPSFVVVASLLQAFSRQRHILNIS